MAKAIHSKFVLCIRPGDSEDLESRKVYQAIPDPKAAKEGYVRVIDESGEDYLYPAECFAPIKLPTPIARRLALNSDSAHEPATSR